MTVRLHATLRRFTPEGYQSMLTVKLDEEATVTLLLEAIGIDLSPEYLMVVINRQRVYQDHPLHDGDVVQLFPPISGGYS
ncbi:MoaD/ThiS family protein [Anaerolineales bacterium HSG24]|nr:MoaD/ThiS family protein [Anaerolineales bacterium HSG24]